MSPLLGSIGGISEYNYRGTLDDWPNPFAFGSLTNVQPGDIVGISTVINGINYKSSVSATSGSLVSVRNIIGITSIYSGDSLTPSDTVTVSIAKSTTELSVGKNIRILNVSDPRYNGEFVISSIINPGDPYVTRFTYELTQTPSTARPGIGTAQFNYEVYPFTENQLVYIRNNQILEVRIPTTSGTDSDFDKQYRTTVRVGKRYATWSVRTKEKDNSPNPFIFNNVTGVNIGIGVTSNSITISGLEPGYSTYAFISSGIGSFSVNGSVGVVTSNVSNGSVIYMNEISSEYYSTTKTSSLTVGTYTTSFSVTTRPADRIPNQFNFNSLINVPINQDQVSISTSLSGADNNVPLNAQVSFPGELQVNSDQYISGTTEVFNGDSVKLKIPAAAIKEYGTTYSTQLTVSGISSSFFIRTRPRPIKTFPDQFIFTDITQASPSTFIESNIITLSGMTVGIADTGLATISGGGSEFRVLRNGSLIKSYDSNSFPVLNGDQIQLRVLSPGEGSLTQCRLVITGVDTRDVIEGISGLTADTWDVASRVLSCKIDEVPFAAALTDVENVKIKQLITTKFVVSGLDNGCDTVITTSNPDSYIRNQSGAQVTSNQPLDIKNGDIITIYMTSASTYDTIKTTTVECKRKNGSDLVSRNWKIKTQLEDKLPDPFNLPTRNQSNVPPCTYRSTFVTESLSGLSEETIVPATVTSSNNTAQISKNGGTFSTSIPEGVKNGDRIDIRLKSNCNYGGSCEVATVTVGERTDVWTLCPEGIPFPTVTLQANSTSIAYDGSVTLTWTSTFATSVTNSSGTGFTGIGSTQGTITINNLKNVGNNTYSITVSNSKGSATSSVTINVSPEPAPTITLTPSSTNIEYDGSLTLSWSSTNATSVSNSSGTGFVGIGSTQGTIRINNLKNVGTNTYSITVSNASGVKATATVQVTIKPEPAPTITLTSTPSVITPGGLSTLTWSSTNATAVVSTSGSGFSNITTLSGSTVVSPTQNTTYSITVRNTSGIQATASASVYVSTPTAPTVTLLSPNLISGNTITLDVGGSITLNWASTNATSVSNYSGSGFIPTSVSGSLVINGINQNTTYNITVTGPGGTATSNSINVVIRKPTVTLSSPNLTSGNTISINPGSSITLNWASTNATSVSNYSGFGFIPSSTSGSLVINGINQNTTYNITVTGPGGTTTSNSINVVVLGPTVTLSASPTTVSHNGSTTLTWSSTNANTISSSNFGASSTSGSLVVSNLTSTTSGTTTKTYTITVSGPGGSASASVNVNILPPPPTASLTANPLSVPFGGSTTLSWVTANASSLTSNFGETALNGSKVISNLTSNQTYTITASSNGITASSSATVTVGPKPPTVEICATNINDLVLPSTKSCITEKTVGYNSGIRLEWTSTDATSVTSTSGNGFTGITNTNGSFTLPYNITTQVTYSITVSGPGGTATDSIIIIPTACNANTFEDTFAVYKFASINFNNGTSASPPPSFSSSPTRLYVSTKTSASLPGRPNFSYSLMHSFIYSAYRTILNRSPEKEGLEYYINSFATNKSKFRTLSELYVDIQNNASTELNDRSSRGGLKSITDSCGVSWDTSNPKPSPTICVSSNITDTSTNAIYKNGFITFGNGVDKIIEEYYISTINQSQTLPNRSNFTFGQVHEYIRSKYSSTLNRVPDKSGFVYWVNDFQSKLSNGNFKYPDLASLGIAIDNAASTELSERSKNNGFMGVFDTCGNIITPQASTCVPKTSSSIYANFKEGTILFNNGTTNPPLQFFVSTKSNAYSTNLPNKPGFTYGQVQDFIANYYTSILGRPVEDAAISPAGNSWVTIFNSSTSITTLEQLGDEISYDYNYVTKEGPIVDSRGGRKWITDTCGEITSVAGPCTPSTSSSTYANFKRGRIIFNNRERDIYYDYFTSSKSNAYSTFLPNKPQFSYGQVQDYIANYYTTNLGRPVEAAAISPTSNSWITIFNSAPGLVTLNDLGNSILTAYNTPTTGERDIVASKGGRRWIHDTCIRIWTP